PLKVTHAASWTASGLATDEATITLTSAPSAAAKLVVSRAAGNADTASADGNNVSGRRVVTLANNGLGLVGNATGVAAPTSGVSTVWIAVDTAGSYAGTIRIKGATDDSIGTFSFTTTGAPASITLDSTAQSVPASGSSNWNATVKDANGNATTLGVFDSIGVTCSATACTGANLTDVADGTTQVTTISAAMIAAGSGTAGVKHIASAGAGTATTISFKAQGTISALGTQTATLTETSQVINVTPLTATVTVTTTPTAGTVTATSPGTGRIHAAAIKTGTSAVTIGITAPTGQEGKEFRFRLTASAGTVDGTASTTSVFKNVVTDATTGKGSFSFTLGGAALLTNATLTVRQVDVVNTTVGYGSDALGLANNGPTQADGRIIVLTQTDATFVAAGITTSPAGTIMAKLGASTSFTVTLKNSYGEALGAGYVVRAYRTANTGTLLDSQVTAADGTAKVAVTNATTLIAAGAETYVFQVQPPFGTAVDAAAGVTINYTTTGAVSTLSLDIDVAQLTGTGLTAARTAATTTAETVIPAINPPITNGAAGANDVTGTGIYTIATAAQTGGGAGNEANAIKLTTTATPANVISYSGSAGVKFVSTAPTTTAAAWDGGTATLDAASGAAVYAFSTKAGLNTVTATSGGLTVSRQFWVFTEADEYYNISVDQSSVSLDPGAYVTLTVSVKDAFGNPVDTAAAAITATASGALLLGGFASTADYETGSDGTVKITAIANNTGGTGTVVITNKLTGNAWGAAYTTPTNATAPVKSVTVNGTVKAASSVTNPAIDAVKTDVTSVKADVKAVSDTVATLSKAVTTIQSSVTELTSSFSAQIKSLSAAIAKISKAIAALSKKIK
ncbi:MAG: hypothetical protein EBU84_04785, partial [Actinobacteria bacterium]|nr:hypothetical protein [Actinomycetota bacterium]